MAPLPEERTPISANPEPDKTKDPSIYAEQAEIDTFVSERNVRRAVEIFKAGAVGEIDFTNTTPKEVFTDSAAKLQKILGDAAAEFSAVNVDEAGIPLN